MVSGLDGLRNGLAPPPPTDDPYATKAAPLPTNLIDAVAALDRSTVFREAFGERFVDYILHIKRAEIARFHATATDWEHRECFETF